MRFTLNLAADNSAFTDDPGFGSAGVADLPRILRTIAAQIEDGRDISCFQTIFDANGNDVGRYALKPDSYFANERGSE